MISLKLCFVLFSLDIILRTVIAFQDSGICVDTQKERKNILKFANSLPVLVEQDKLVSKLWTKQTKDENVATYDSIRHDFYEMTSQTFQTACSVVKKFGGQWKSECNTLDGQKTICMDKLYRDILRGECLVYSFGVGEDFSFELAMANMGCTVRAFDLYVDSKEEEFLGHPNITFSYVGLSNVKGRIEISEGGDRQLLTLRDTIQMMGDTGKKISYLKVDVEGAEITAIRNWIIDKLPQNIDQIAIEFHTNKQIIKKWDAVSTFTDLMDDLRDLHRLGFRSISYEANLCMGKLHDKHKSYYSFFDIVLYKK